MSVNKVPKVKDMNKVPKVKLYKLVEGTELSEFDGTDFKTIKTDWYSVLYGIGLEDGEEYIDYSFEYLEDAQKAIENVVIDSDLYEEYTVGSKWWMPYNNRQIISVKVRHNVWILESDGPVEDNTEDPIFLSKLVIVEDQKGNTYKFTSTYDEIRDNLKKEFTEFVKKDDE